MAVLPFVAAAGGLFSAYGAIQAGEAAAQEGEATAAQLITNAGQERASGQFAAAEELRKSDLMMSRMLAVAAASGGGVSDPTVVKIAGGIAQEGALAAATRRYTSESSARGMEAQADAARRTGQARKRASYWQAAGGLLSTASAFR